MRNCCIGVLQVSDKDQPEVDNEVRNYIDFHQPCYGMQVWHISKETYPDYQSQVTDDDIFIFLFAEYWTIGVEMVGVCVIFPSAYMKQQIPRPTKQRQFQQVHNSPNKGQGTHSFCIQLSLSAGYEYFIMIHIIRAPMVLGVTNSPWMIRHEESRV